jgi:phage-related minor tail protein
MNHLSFAATGEGGLKGAFAGLGPVLTGALRFINPVTVGLTAVAGAALAANRALDQQREERVATTSGLGRFGQATAADVGAIANRAAGNGVSIGQAREAVLAFTRAGVENNDVIERGTGLVQRYATTVGGDFVDAQKDLAKLAAEPAKAIDAIAAITGIDAEVTNHVKLLDSLGNKTGAAKEAFDALDKALVRDADASTTAGRARAYLVSQLTKGLDVAGRLALFQEPTPDTGAGKRAAEQAAAITRPGFARALPGETPAFRPRPASTRCRRRQQRRRWRRYRERLRDENLSRKALTRPFARARKPIS